MISLVVQFATPKRLLLNGLWFGPEKAKRVCIFVHGLSSDMLSGHKILLPLVDHETAALFFNNRGYGIINRITKLDKRKKKGQTSINGGAAHEIFTDCVDDIQGAVNFAIKNGAKEIILVGHSTGCQKSIYYLAKSNVQGAKSIISIVLLSPLSDYAGVKRKTQPEVLRRATEYALQAMMNHEPDTLLPLDIWSETIDAQRFLSLYTPESKEEIFPYAQSKKKPVVLQKIKTPMLIIFGEKDQYRDRSIKALATWFSKYTKKQKANVEIIPSADHSFTGIEHTVASNIKKWLQLTAF